MKIGIELRAAHNAFRFLPRVIIHAFSYKNRIEKLDFFQSFEIPRFAIAAEIRESGTTLRSDLNI